jgi:hypothetical protein
MLLFFLYPQAIPVGKKHGLVLTAVLTPLSWQKESFGTVISAGYKGLNLCSTLILHNVCGHMTQVVKQALAG